MANLLTTEGRIPRSTFWKFFIFLYLFLGIIGGVSGSGKVSPTLTGILGLLALPFMIVGIIVQVKRWHDRNKSGWWVLINFVPCIGGLWALIECGFLPGTPGPNRFGPDPLGRG